MICINVLYILIAFLSWILHVCKIFHWNQQETDMQRVMSNDFPLLCFCPKFKIVHCHTCIYFCIYFHRNIPEVYLDIFYYIIASWCAIWYIIVLTLVTRHVYLWVIPIVCFLYRGSKQKHNFVTQNCYSVLQRGYSACICVCMVVHMNSMQRMKLFD